MGYIGNLIDKREGVRHSLIPSLFVVFGICMLHTTTPLNSLKFPLKKNTMFFIGEPIIRSFLWLFEDIDGATGTVVILVARCFSFGVMWIVVLGACRRYAIFYMAYLRHAVLGYYCLNPKLKQRATKIMSLWDIEYLHIFLNLNTPFSFIFTSHFSLQPTFEKQRIYSSYFSAF